MADLAKLAGLVGLHGLPGPLQLNGPTPVKRGGGRGTPRFTISPAIGGKTVWDLDRDGPLVIPQTSAGVLYTLTAEGDFTAPIKMWGAGGGQRGAGRCGGGGGMVGGVMRFRRGAVYTLLAGEDRYQHDTNNLQGGGKSNLSGTTNTGCPGGGFSFIRRGASGTDYLAIAPGGGGSGWAGAGGAGGDFEAGLDGYGRNTAGPGADGGGKGATATAGGAKGAGSGGQAGSAFQGGNSSGGGGGGGGYFGGGGAGNSTSSPGNGGGGGGGVAYVNPDVVSRAYAIAGGKDRPADMTAPIALFVNAARPGGYDDPDNNGAGWGGMDSGVNPAGVAVNAGTGGRIILF